LERWSDPTRVIVFEDDGLGGFGPLTALRHASQLRWGTKTILESIAENVSDATDVGLWGREGVSEVTRESTGKDYNEKAEGTVLLVNARARPGQGLLELCSKRTPFAAVDGGALVAARADLASFQPGVVSAGAVAKLTRRVDRVDPPADSLFRGYWDLVRTNGLAVAAQAPKGEQPFPPPEGALAKGAPSNLWVDPSAEVEPNVVLDARLGPVIVEPGATVESFSRLTGPCYLGPRTRVFGARVGGGTSVFEGCKVGGQVENSVIMAHTNKAHHGYVGDSYVGEWVNLGAGSTFSNLKNTYGGVKVAAGGKRVETGMLHLGPAIGDMSKISIGSLVYAGKFVGIGSHVAGLAPGDVPSFTYFDGGSGRQVELELDSVIETQRRMMERRDRTLTRAEGRLIRAAFAATASERRKAGVRRGRL
jgi:UDP-N-acetylglucosamine diphosphorylase/glucosamine-1-phosphate N-acetyltransferase